jgi:hypothetical protein
MRKRAPAVDVVRARRGAELFRVALEPPSGDPANPCDNSGVNSQFVTRFVVGFPEPPKSSA